MGRKNNIDPKRNSITPHKKMKNGVLLIIPSPSPSPSPPSEPPSEPTTITFSESTSASKNTKRVWFTGFWNSMLRVMLRIHSLDSVGLRD
ncbi:hypothetical protein FNV43_RR02112 [Rhamnella rubrinervis]|uniref:Uncharacterized protein n=1 Tax=Rhamnella rubrinervis TaxID=2594499 RepID=A0A8K0HTD8_9ROSA|nr:hypothetical protein FNV43_RR02112 [Rhamnella rubrinervis]